MKNVSNAETNVGLVQGLYEAYGRGDMPGLLAGCAPDIDWESIGPQKDFPLFGPRRGRAGVADFFNVLVTTFDFTEFSPRTFVASGDEVVVLGHYALTMKKSGRKMASDWAMVFTVHDGLVTRFREHTDSAQFVAAYRPAMEEGTDVAANKALVRRWVEECWNQGRLDHLDAFYTADVVQHSPNGPAVSNREELRAYVATYRTAIPDLAFAIESMVGEGDRVIWRFSSHGTQTGPLMGLPPTGKSATVTGMVEFRFVAGRVAEVWVNLDALGLFQALGVIPALG